ncbi:MAG: transporter [Phaeodactylibacter sp.]|nr:transporter [Phaeodactylibacter sp.]
MRIRPRLVRTVTVKQQFDDLGFGTKIGSEGARLINRDGTFNIERKGRRAWTPYQSLVEMSWMRFLLLVLGFFIAVNFFFALLFFWAGTEYMSGIDDDPWWLGFLNCFFFSVQTFTTVGYGAISPTHITTNAIASFDALVGLISLALATGLFFARFSKPTAQIVFSKHGIIAPYQDGLSFQFRIANRRNNKIIDLEAKVTMAWTEWIDGEKRRRFAALPLERDKIFMFPLNWTLVHPIDINSPLYGKSEEDFRKSHAEFLVLIEGHDETFAQTVHTISSYTWEEVVWGVRFDRMYYPDQTGRTVLWLDKIDKISAVEGLFEEEE